MRVPALFAQRISAASRSVGCVNSPLKTAQLILILTVAFAAKGCGKGADTAGSEEPTGMATGLAGTWKTDCLDETVPPGAPTSATYEITFPAHRINGNYSYIETRHDNDRCDPPGTVEDPDDGGTFHIGTEHSCTDTDGEVTASCVDLDFDVGDPEWEEYTVFKIAGDRLYLPAGGSTPAERPSSLEDSAAFTKQ